MNDAEKAQQRKVAHGVTDGSKVTIDRFKLEQVLEALESQIVWFSQETMIGKSMREKAHNSITILKEALEDV